MNNKEIKNLGIGIGLRPVHYEDIFSKKPGIDWFEIISENFMNDAPLPQFNLEKILDQYPVVQHGVSLAIGSPDPLDFSLFEKVKKTN